jgi:hypothetical protein
MVDAYVAAEMDRQHLPGLSLAIVKDGKIIKAKGYGMADLELAVPASPETVFELGSADRFSSRGAGKTVVAWTCLGYEPRRGGVERRAASPPHA